MLSELQYLGGFLITCGAVGLISPRWGFALLLLSGVILLFGY